MINRGESSEVSFGAISISEREENKTDQIYQSQANKISIGTQN